MGARTSGQIVSLANQVAPVSRAHERDAMVIALTGGLRDAAQVRFMKEDTRPTLIALAIGVVPSDVAFTEALCALVRPTMLRLAAYPDLFRNKFERIMAFLGGLTMITLALAAILIPAWLDG